MTIASALAGGANKLEAAGVPDPALDAQLLLCHVLGIPRMQMMLSRSQSLTNNQERRYSSLLLLRAARQPLQYLLGEQYFYGLRFLTDARALIPRPETETLCELALRYLREIPSPVVLDLCTGSGALAVAIRHERPDSSLTATDISADALALAQRNATLYDEAVTFLQGDLFAPVAGQRFDAIVCNPPYIETRACDTLQQEVLFEPRMALDGGADGLSFYRRLASEARGHLKDGGALLMEVGDGQADRVAALLESDGRYPYITHFNDLAGRQRVVVASLSAFPT